MNKKNKILISAAGMLVLTAAAASASTFAWFTTVRNAQINYSSAEVYSSSSDLTVSWVDSLMTGATYTSADAQNISVSRAHRITDISGNGAHFYKPIWNSSDTTSAVADSVTTLNVTDGGAADGYYVDFTLAISQNAAATGNMNVYVGQDTSITPHTAGDNEDIAAVKAARIAILDESLEPVFIWTPDDDDAEYNYVEEDAGGTWKTQAGFAAVSQTEAMDSLDAVNGDKFYAGPLTTYTTTALNTQHSISPIVTLYGTSAATPDYSKKITIRAWLEGEDPECVNITNGTNALGGVFDFSIDIYGVAA